MKVKIHKYSNSNIIELESDAVLISTAQDAINLLDYVEYQYGVKKMVLKKENINTSLFLGEEEEWSEIQKIVHERKFKLIFIGNFEKSDCEKFYNYFSNEKRKNIIEFYRNTEEAVREFEKK